MGHFSNGLGSRWAGVHEFWLEEPGLPELSFVTRGCRYRRPGKTTDVGSAWLAKMGTPCPTGCLLNGLA